MSVVQSVQDFHRSHTGFQGQSARRTSNGGTLRLDYRATLRRDAMGLLPDTQNCRLRMRRECRERFPPPQQVSDPDMHHGTCVTHVPRCMPGSLTSGFLWSRWREKRSRHSRRMRNRNFMYLVRGPLGLDRWPMTSPKIGRDPIKLRRDAFLVNHILKNWSRSNYNYWRQNSSQSHYRYRQLVAIYPRWYNYDNIATNNNKKRGCTRVMMVKERFCYT